MIEEKTRRSKTHRNKEIGVCAKSVQSPIVLLERLHIGADGPTLIKATVTDKLSDSVKCDKTETSLAGEQKSKKSTLRNSSAAVLDDSTSNDKSSIQCTNPTDTAAASQSTSPDLDGGTALSKTTSFKFKKKLKRLEKTTLDTDKKLSEKIKENPKLSTDITAAQKTKISVTVSTRKKQAEIARADDNRTSTVITDSEQHNLKTNLSQEQVVNGVSLGEQVFDNSRLLNDISATEETAQIKTSIPTKNRLLRSAEVNDCTKSNVQNSLPDGSTSNISQLVNGESLSQEKESHLKNLNDSNGIENSARNTISTRNKLRQINKTNKSNESIANASPVKISNKSPSIEKIEKQIPADETADTIKNNGAENIIKTRSTLHEEAKAGDSESPSVTKSRQKKISNKSVLTGKVVEQEVKEIDLTGAKDNNNIKSILTRSRLSDAKKTDDNNESFVVNETSQSKQNDLKINISKVKTNSKSLSVGTSSGDLKLTTNTTIGTETPVKSTISTKSKLQDKVKVVGSENLKARKSAIRNKNAESVQSNSTTDSSQIQINGHSSSNTFENEAIQPSKTHSTPSSSNMQIDDESFVNGSVLDQSMSTVDASTVEEKINKGERISTRSKTFVSEKSITEKNVLQPEKVQPASAVTSEKSLLNTKLNDTPKSVARTLKTKESNDIKNNISTRSRSLEKVKSNDNKKLTIEKSSDDVTVQPEQNQNVSTPYKVQINNEISNSTRSPKKMNAQSTVSTKSKIEKSKTNNQEKSIAENKTVHLEQNHSTPESLTVQITEQLIPNDTVQSSLKPSTDLPKTKECTPTKSKSHEEKKESENKTAHAHTGENTMSKRSKRLEKNKNDHVNGTLENIDLNLEKGNVTSDSSAAVISNKSVENENIPGSPKQLANSNKSLKKVDIKITRSTRSKLLENNEPENHEESIVENGAASVEQTNSTVNSSQAKNKSESPKDAPANVDNSSNTISTRSGLTRKPSTDVKPRERKRKSLAEKSQSPAKSQAHNESIVHKKIAETKSCDMNGQQRVCYDKEVVIKLFRCDQAQPVVNRSTEKETPKKKSLRGKRKAEHESTVEETPKAKKSILDVSSKDLPVTNDTQSLTVDNQVQLGTSEDTGKSVVESQSNMEPDVGDSNVIKSIENVSKNYEETEKDSCPENVSDINLVDNTISKNPEMPGKANECDNKRAENEKEIVNSSGDNISVHGDELLEDRDEGISVDTSENETNAETPVVSDNLVVEESMPTTATRNMESHNSLGRNIVEELMNDWAVPDDDKTDDIDNTGVNQDVSTPEVIQIDDNDDIEMVVEEPREAVSTGNAKDKRSSQNKIATSRENPEISGVAVSNSPRIRKEKRITVTDVRTVEDHQSSNLEKENSTSEQTSEMSEIEDVDDSNFESVDEGSCTETFANENPDEQEDNVSQETITYYNSEDISMEVGVSVNDNRLNDVVMNLKDACDKITADLRRVNTSYESNEEAPNHQEPEVLCISDDSNGEQEEDEDEEVMIIEPTNPIHEPTIQIHEPTIEIHEQDTPLPEQQQNFFFSNPYHHVMQQGSPSISVIKASELRDAQFEPPVEYPVKPTEPHVVYPQRQMHSTTLLPASMINDTQTSSIFTEDTIMQCPKCRCDFVGKSRLRRHWLTCGDAMYLCCPFCPNRVKQRRSLINHLNTQHPDQISQEEAVKITEQIVKQTREAAGVKLKQGCHLAIQDFIRSSCAVPMIELPAFIRIQCVVCNKVYEEVPATYKKTCDDCSSDLMTAICQLCRKQYMLSTKVALHVQGNCIFSGRVKCRDCGFESSGRYHLQEHIIRKHIYVAPEDYVVCSLGCGKTFRVHDQLRKHERVCGKEPNLDCKLCDYKTKHRSAMKLHVQQHIASEKANDEGRGLEDAQAEEDVRDLITEQQVRSVIRVHCSRCERTLRLTSNRSSCEYCKLSFTFSCSRCSDSHRLDSLHAARLHVIRSHSVKIHECPHCSQKFSYVYDLTRHASKCTAKFGCEYCNYRTDQETKLRDHARRVHPAARMDSLHCKKCGKWFTRGDSLRRHEMRNCGVVPRFSCEHCQFKTKTKYSLLRHIQTQHAYIYEHFSFVCDRCDKFYNNMFAYEVHVKNCHALACN